MMGNMKSSNNIPILFTCTLVFNANNIIKSVPGNTEPNEFAKIYLKKTNKQTNNL